jgi:glycine cleavage system regulatory protein
MAQDHEPALSRMQIPLVMTIIGPDRTGLVESIARAVAEHGGNWLESRMCRLGGEFAGILRVEIPAANKAALQSALEKLQSNGLQIVVRADQPVSAATAGRQIKLELIGADHPGIVREISAALAKAGVNVEELTSELVSAPMSGETMFKAIVRLHLPEKCELALLKRDLEKIAADLLVDVSFADVAGK